MKDLGVHENNKRAFELAEKLRQMKPLLTLQQRLEQEKEKMKMKQRYAWRKWNGKKQMREKVWKPYPPKDTFYSWD